MSETLIGVVTFGGLAFTQLTIKSIRETVTKPYKIFVVVGKPDDTFTTKWLEEEKIPYIKHDINLGFPASVNDIYDFAWKLNSFDNFVAIGNDVIAYPYAIDSLIEVADTTDFEWVCSSQFDVRNLCKDFPETRKFFLGDNYKFHNFTERPWEAFTKWSSEIKTSEAGLSDVHNLALFKKSVFERIGYIDVNFYPAYYEDNDYVRRAVHAGIKSCSLNNSWYFHFWSRTVKQGAGGSTHAFFKMNKKFYIKKWGGDFGEETFQIPFNGNVHVLDGNIELHPTINIQDRNNERDIVKYWMKKGGR
jgi:GT2 family glycosyltransferase